MVLFYFRSSIVMVLFRFRSSIGMVPFCFRRSIVIVPFYFRSSWVAAAASGAGAVGRVRARGRRGRSVVTS
ncbi:hypothetical protein, partial [Streptomyces scabiei]|uniref:hypothetical protein n=1 Tax=Streptomyces scabiei TaxID=1930 RepID=UPI00131C3B00